MSLKDLLALIEKDGAGWLLLIVVIMSLIQITPIQVNPWSAIFGWLGKQFNKESDEKRESEIKELKQEIASIKKDVENVGIRLDDHIEESKEQNVSDRRNRIIDVAGRMKRGQVFEVEQVDFLMTECDKYEMYCRDNNISNGVATHSIRTIRDYYDLTHKGELKYGEKGID